MLTHASRAAARHVVTTSRRVVFSHRLAIASSTRYVVRSSTVARGFATSQWRRQAARSNDDDGDVTTKKATKKSTKSTASKKKTSTAAATKKKAAKPKKKAVAKKKAPVKTRAVMTPEQKKQLNDSVNLKALKTLSLHSAQPTTKPNRSWVVFLKEKMTTHTGKLADRVQELKSEWDNVSASDKERYASIAAVNHQDNEKALKAWVQSLPAEDIFLANYARSRLNKLTGKKSASSIPDDRIPKRPGTPFSKFMSMRLRSSTGGDIQSTFKDYVEEWKNASDEMKKPFEEGYEDEKAAYAETMAPLREKAKAKKQATRAAAREAIKKSPKFTQAIAQEAAA